MLTILHEMIAKVCPIVGVSETPGGAYRIDFADTATDDQKRLAFAIAESFDAEKLALTAEIKARAAADIYAKLPVWKQINILARMLELIDKRISGVPLTDQEQEEIAAAKDARDFVKQRRAQSDAEEEAVKNGR